MKKFLRGMLCVGVIAFACMAGKAYAGEKANVVVSDSAGKALVIKTVSIISGSGTAASGLGTVTGAVFANLSTNTGSATVTKYAISGASVTFYNYNTVTGGTSTSDGTGTAFLWGTP